MLVIYCNVYVTYTKSSGISNLQSHHAMNAYCTVNFLPKLRLFNMFKVQPILLSFNDHSGFTLCNPKVCNNARFCL